MNEHIFHIFVIQVRCVFFLGDQVVRFILYVCMYIFFCYFCPIPLNSEAWLRNIQTNKAMSNAEKYNKNKIYLNAKANAPLYTYIYLFILQTHPWVPRVALRRRQRDSTMRFLSFIATYTMAKCKKKKHKLSHMKIEWNKYATIVKKFILLLYNNDGNNNGQTITTATNWQFVVNLYDAFSFFFLSHSFFLVVFFLGWYLHMNTLTLNTPPLKRI